MESRKSLSQALRDAISTMLQLPIERFEAIVANGVLGSYSKVEAGNIGGTCLDGVTAFFTEGRIEQILTSISF